MHRQAVRLLAVAGHHRVLIPAAALLAVIPMLIRGPSCGHDFDFHLLSWLEASRQFTQLTFPHWADTPAFNAGEPRFVFYPPVSWILGAILGSILPWSVVPTAFTWIALTLSGLTFRAFARRYTSPSGATLGGILYLANPYMLFTAYERSAFAELLAAAWLPLLLGAVLPGEGTRRAAFQGSSFHVDPGTGSDVLFSRRGGRRRILGLGVAIALLWLTNAPAAVMSCYAMAFLLLVQVIDSFVLSIASHAMDIHSSLRHNLNLAVTGSAGTTLGLALAAFYVLPAAYERRFVQIQMLVIEGMRVSDHFLFHRMPDASPDARFHDSVVRGASVISVALIVSIGLAVGAIALGMRSSRSGTGRVLSSPGTLRRPRLSNFAFRETILPLALLTLAIAFLLTPVSLPVWDHLPEFAFLQFPWRLSALLGLIFAFCTILALPRGLHSLSSSVFLAACAVAAILFIPPAWHVFRQRCAPEDTVAARVALFQSNLGTEPTDEYTPLHADPDSLHPNDPPYWLIPLTPDQDAGVNAPAPEVASPGPAPRHLTLTLPAPEYLILNLRDYPAWQVELNGKHLQPTAPERRLAREDGLVALLLPAGPDTVDLRLIRTPDETLGLAISGFALLLCLYLYFKPHGTAQAPLPSGISPAMRP